MVLPPTSQEDMRAHILKALDGREIENVVFRAESRPVEASGWVQHIPTGRQFIEVTTLRSDPIQDAIDAPADAVVIVVADDTPDPEMALPAWRGEADETVTP